MRCAQTSFRSAPLGIFARDPRVIVKPVVRLGQRDEFVVKIQPVRLPRRIVQVNGLTCALGDPPPSSPGMDNTRYCPGVKVGKGHANRRRNSSRTTPSPKSSLRVTLTRIVRAPRSLRQRDKLNLSPSPTNSAATTAGATSTSATATNALMRPQAWTRPAPASPCSATLRTCDRRQTTSPEIVRNNITSPTRSIQIHS